jgi:hypothetical protein
LHNKLSTNTAIPTLPVIININTISAYNGDIIPKKKALGVELWDLTLVELPHLYNRTKGIAPINPIANIMAPIIIKNLFHGKCCQASTMQDLFFHSNILP